MSDELKELSITGYKSIKSVDRLPMRMLNILIGANGAGKSNFIGFFKLLERICAGEVQLHIQDQGGPDALLHFGRRTSPILSARFWFGNNGYSFELQPTQDNRMVFKSEHLHWDYTKNRDYPLGSGHDESRMLAVQKYKYMAENFVTPALSSWRVYHFHDTSDKAEVKQIQPISDNQRLQPNAKNLAAYLLLLRDTYQEHYRQIVAAVKQVAPFFGDFVLRPNPRTQDTIELEWREAGQDTPFKAHQFSDGTLRFICLCTLLLQPDALMPKTVLIDEPELGLHPFAIALLADLLTAASQKHQIIVSTQSVELVNHFAPEDLIVVNREGGASTLMRPDAQQLEAWMKEYALGELWKGNFLGGRPSAFINATDGEEVAEQPFTGWFDDAGKGR